MKKTILAIVLLFVTCAVFALDGIVIDVLGKVEKQSGNSWVTLKKGDVLMAGDVISTGFKSEAVINIGESTITVRALTRMTIEQLYEKNDNHVSSVYLDVGSVSADVKPVTNKRVGFTVKTPAVTASVRGTAGIVYAYGKVEGIRGKWGVSAPQQKNIVYNRGDADNQESSVENQDEMNQPDNLGVDVELETLLAGPSANNEVYVSAGEVANVIPTELNGVQMPKESKKEDVEKLSNSLSVSGSDSDTFRNNIVGNQFASIYIEIIVPEQEL